jgi:hypothetical protein
VRFSSDEIVEALAGLQISRRPSMSAFGSSRFHLALTLWVARKILERALRPRAAAAAEVHLLHTGLLCTQGRAAVIPSSK